MKRYLITLASLAAMLLAGCSSMPDVRYDDSHQRFIEQTMANLEIPETIVDHLSDRATVSIVSLEEESTTDAPVISLVEDALIAQLIGAGHVLVERDADMIARFLAEGLAETYTHTYLPGDLVVENVGVSGGLSSTASLWDRLRGGWVSSHGSQTRLHGLGRDTLLTIDTPMTPAKFILAYRVLECGLVYRPGGTQKQMQRESRVRLHVRLHDARTGEIVAAETVENVATDLVEKRAIKWLRDYHYRYYPPSLPVHSGNPGGRYIGGRGDADNASGSDGGGI